jgi:hypothetical protein
MHYSTTPVTPFTVCVINYLIIAKIRLLYPIVGDTYSCFARRISTQSIAAFIEGSLGSPQAQLSRSSPQLRRPTQGSKNTFYASMGIQNHNPLTLVERAVINLEVLTDGSGRVLSHQEGGTAVLPRMSAQDSFMFSIRGRRCRLSFSISESLSAAVILPCQFCSPTLAREIAPRRNNISYCICVP